VSWSRTAKALHQEKHRDANLSSGKSTAEIAFEGCGLRVGYHVCPKVRTKLHKRIRLSEILGVFGRANMAIEMHHGLAAQQIRETCNARRLSSDSKALG